MTTEIVQTNEYSEYGEVQPEATPTNVSPPTEPMIISDTSTTDSAEDAWKSVQVKATAFFAEATQSTVTFFRENRRLLSTLGWTFLFFLGTRMLFAALDAIDDLPLVTPLLKLIGLATVAWFVWRYLMRANNRQELTQTLDRVKRELFGSRELD